jgi:hypothetical protein
MTQLILFDYAAMQWRQGRASYRPSQEPIDPDQFSVELIGDGPARAFVTTHHYSRSYPAAVAAYGLFERVAPHQQNLVGVAVFSVPMQPKAADAYGAKGAPFCELGRFVLLDHVGDNGESWFLRRALKQLGTDKRTPDGRSSYALCLAYSDPVPRTDLKGRVIFSGHYGRIYGASSALYLGRGTARTHWLTPDGTIVSPRALSKLRNEERGARYAYEFLIGHGAPPIRTGESNADYIRRALSNGRFRKLRHAGNHAYALPCGSYASRKTVRQRMDRNLPRPISTDRIAA